jgi:hypothetical protein
VPCGIRKLLGVKTAGATFIVPKVEKIRGLNLRIPKGLLKPAAGKILPEEELQQNRKNMSCADNIKAEGAITGSRRT